MGHELLRCLSSEKSVVVWPALNVSNISLDISGLEFDQAKSILHDMEHEGIKRVWLTENYYADAFVEVTALSNSTERIQFGTMVAGIFARSPMITALAAISLSNVSGGRFVLGLGTQTRNSVEYWYGRDFVRPLAQMSEFVQITRGLLSGKKVTYNGKYFSVRNLQLPPPSHPIKIFVAAIGPKMNQLAGRVADGVMGTFWTPKYIEETVIPNVKIGAERAGRSLKDFDIICSYECFPGSESSAHEAMKPHLVSLATVPLFEPIFRGAGYGSECKSINAAIKSGDMTAALTQVSPEMINDLELIGDSPHFKARLGRLKKAGLTEIALHPYVGNVFYEHYPDQFPFDIQRFNTKPVYEGLDSYTAMLGVLREYGQASQ